MLKTVLIDAPTGTRAHVGIDGAQLVQGRPIPPFGAPLDATPFESFMVDEAGSSDMTVLASPASPATFRVKANNEGDIWIKSLSFDIGGVTMTLGDFGPIPALTNPCTLFYQNERETITISDAISTNSHLMRLGGELMPGVGGTVAEALKVGFPGGGMSTIDTYVAYLDFARVFGFPFGVRLEKGTNQSVGLLIQDDLTAVDEFNCEAYGFLRVDNTERA